MKRTIATTLVLCWFGFGAHAQVPEAISFQGYLTDDKGTEIEGPTDLTISLYNAPTKGSLVWTRTYSALPVVHGIFNLLLEAGSPDLSSLEFDQTFWVQLETGGEMLVPRTALVSAPYALGARNMRLTDDGDVVVPSGDAILPSGYLLADSLLYNSPRAHRLSIPSNAFKPDEVAPDTWYVADGISAYFVVQGTTFFGSGPSMNAPVYLPDGSVLTRFRCWVRDDTDSTFLKCSLLQHNTDGTNSPIVDLSTIAQSGDLVLDSGPFTSLPINNGAHAYSVVVRPLLKAWNGDSLLVRKALIDYQVSVAE